MTDPKDNDDLSDPQIDDLDPGLEETNQFRPSMDTDSLEVSGFLDATSNPEAESDDEVVFESDPTNLEPGDLLGKYLIKKILGQGGMGAVYLGFDQMIQREVAIKVLTKTANSSVALDRFIAEARATGKLNHPNVVAIYDINQEGDTSYIVMELVRGGSGTDYIEDRSEIDWVDSVKIAAQAADGLAAAHRAELVHRDIKPENLMLTEDGVAKVVDFGLSKLIDSAADQNLNLTMEGIVLGTPRYMSPEQFQSDSVVDARSDVYCLGGTLFSLVTGLYPFPKANNMIAVMKAHVSNPPPDPLEYNSELPEAIREIVAKAMAKTPDDRYQNAGEMAEALWSVLDSQVSSVDQPVAEEYRSCSAALIVEPSKMQAMMLAKQLQQAGVSKVSVVASAAEAQSVSEAESPDMVITAKQLADLDGVALLEAMSRDTKLDQSTFVLNTSDVDNEILLSLSRSSTLAVVSKRTKPATLIRSLFASTFFELEPAESDSQFDSLSFRLGIVSDSARIPETIEGFIRDDNILDLNFASYDQLASGSSSILDRDLVLILRNAGETEDDNRVYSELLRRMPDSCPNRVAVQVSGTDLRMRAIQIGEFSALTRMPFDANRWSRLLRTCSS